MHSVHQVGPILHGAAEDAGQTRVAQNLRIAVGQATGVNKANGVGIAARDVAEEQAQAFRQIHKRSQRAVLLSGKRRHVDRVQRDPALQVFDHLLGNADPDNFLRFFRGTGNVRSGHDAIVRKQRIFARRFFLEDVEAGARHLTGSEGTLQRGSINQFSAGAVDDANTGFHRGERGIVQHAIGIGCQ